MFPLYCRVSQDFLYLCTGSLLFRKIRRACLSFSREGVILPVLKNRCASIKQKEKKKNKHGLMFYLLTSGYSDIADKGYGKRYDVYE